MDDRKGLALQAENTQLRTRLEALEKVAEQMSTELSGAIVFMKLKMREPYFKVEEDLLCSMIEVKAAYEALRK